MRQLRYAALSFPGQHIIQYKFNNPFKKAMELSLKRVARLLKAPVFCPGDFVHLPVVAVGNLPVCLPSAPAGASAPHRSDNCGYVKNTI